MGTIAERKGVIAHAPIVETYETVGHQSHVHSKGGWGDPGQWQAHCSCGWVGTLLTEAAYVDGSGVIGRRDDAVGQMLSHAGYTQEEATRQFDQRVTELLAQISQAAAAIEDERVRMRRLVRAASVAAGN